MKVVTDTISLNEFKEIPQKMYHQLVKAVVGLEPNMVVNAQLHSDEEMLLLEEYRSVSWRTLGKTQYGGHILY